MEALNMNARQTDAVLDVTESMMETGHHVTVSRPREWDEDKNGVYVCGYKTSALDRTAFVHDCGNKIDWIH